MDSSFDAYPAADESYPYNRVGGELFSEGKGDPEAITAHDINGQYQSYCQQSDADNCSDIFTEKLAYFIKYSHFVLLLPQIL